MMRALCVAALAATASAFSSNGEFQDHYVHFADSSCSYHFTITPPNPIVVEMTCPGGTTSTSFAIVGPPSFCASYFYPYVDLMGIDAYGAGLTGECTYLPVNDGSQNGAIYLCGFTGVQYILVAYGDDLPTDINVLFQLPSVSVMYSGTIVGVNGAIYDDTQECVLESTTCWGSNCGAVAPADCVELQSGIEGCGATCLDSAQGTMIYNRAAYELGECNSPKLTVESCKNRGTDENPNFVETVVLTNAEPRKRTLLAWHKWTGLGMIDSEELGSRCGVKPSRVTDLVTSLFMDLWSVSTGKMMIKKADRDGGATFKVSVPQCGKYYYQAYDWINSANCAMTNVAEMTWTVNGFECPSESLAVVDDKGCKPKKGDFEGMVCANDDLLTQAYCSYDLGNKACALCYEDLNMYAYPWLYVNNQLCYEVEVLDWQACDQGREAEGKVCGGGKGFCSYAVGEIGRAHV